MRRKPYNKWLVCAGAAILLFCTTGLTISAFSVYLPYIRSTHGFTNAQTSALLTVRSTMSLVTMVVVDRFFRRVKLRLGVFLSIAGVAAGFFLYGVADSYFLCCVASALCGLFYGLSGTTAASLLINSWFDENKGSALGIASAGTGVASIISPVIIVPLIEKLSLRAAFFAEGIFVLICAVAAWLLIRNGEGLDVLLRAKAKRPDGKRELLLRVPGADYGLLVLGVFLGGLVIYGVTGVISMLLRERFSGTEMSLLISVFGIALMAGKVAYGRIADKLGAYRANYILFAVLAVGLVGITMAKSFAVALVMTVLVGAGSPLANVAVPVYAGDFAGEGMYAKAVKTFTIIMSVSGLIIGAVSGILADIFGSYVLVFLIMAGMTVVSAVLIQLVYIRDRKRSAGKT